MSAIEKTTVKNLPPVAGKLKKLHVAGRLREKDGEGRRASPRLKLLIGEMCIRDRDDRVVKLLDGKQLSVERIREFTDEETDETLRSILAEKSKGISVRRAISNLAGGDDKLMLRLQNKYRNILKKQPERIEAIAAELGLGTGAAEKSFLQRRLENEINALYDKLALSLKEENARLSSENIKLRRENEALKRRSSFKEV